MNADKSLDGKNNLQFTEKIWSADVRMDGGKNYQYIFSSQIFQIYRYKYGGKFWVHKFSPSVDVSMDGELARGTLINGRSLAQTTFAPATNTKALQYKYKNKASTNTQSVWRQIQKNSVR